MLDKDDNVWYISELNFDTLRLSSTVYTWFRNKSGKKIFEVIDIED